MSGSFGVAVTNASGSSSYTIQYSYPSVVTVGQNATVTIVLFVNQLTGLKLFVSAYNVTATVGSNSSGFVGSGTVGYWPPSTALGASGDLYPGAHWGPEKLNVTITTPASGGSSLGTPGYLTIGLVTKVSTYDAIGAPAVEEFGNKVVGPLTIEGGSSGGISLEALLPVIAVAAAVILVGAYWVIRRRGAVQASGTGSPESASNTRMLSKSGVHQILLPSVQS